MNDQQNQNEAACGGSALTAELAACQVETVAAWYCKLNCYEWPEDFPMQKPAGWDDITDRQKHELPEMKAAWDAVDSAVPRKEKSRAWHKGGYCGEPKTDEQFEAWWQTTGCEVFGG